MKLPARNSLQGTKSKSQKGLVPLSALSMLSVVATVTVTTIVSTGAARAETTVTETKSSNSTWSTYYSKGEKALSEGDLDKAESSFRQALSLARAQFNNSEDVEQCMLKLGDTLTLSYKTEEARSLYNQLLSQLTKKYGAKSTRLAPALVALGSIEESVGNHTTAMTYYNRAFHVYERKLGPYSPAYANTLHHLTVSQPSSAEAMQASDRGSAMLWNEAGLTASKRLAETLKEPQDLLKGNDESNRDLVQDFTRDLGSSTDESTDWGSPSPQNHSQNQNYSPPLREPGSTSPNNSSTSISTSSSSSTSTPEAASALPLHTERLSPGSSSSGPSYSWTETNKASSAQASASTAGNASPGQDGTSSAWERQYGIDIEKQRRNETVENSGISSRSLSRPAADATLSPAFKVINETVFDQSQYGKSEEYYKRAIAADIDALGAYHPSVANDLIGLAQLYISQKRYSAAEPLLNRALSIYQQSYDTGNILYINTLITLASVEFHLGNSDRAAALYQTALSHGQSRLGPDSAETARVLNGLADLYFRRGQLKQSCTFYQWAIASTEASMGENSPLLAASLRDYARVLRSLGRNTEATVVEDRANHILAQAQ